MVLRHVDQFRRRPRPACADLYKGRSRLIDDRRAAAREQQPKSSSSQHAHSRLRCVDLGPGRHSEIAVSINIPLNATGSKYTDSKITCRDCRCLRGARTIPPCGHETRRRDRRERHCASPHYSRCIFRYVELTGNCQAATLAILNFPGRMLEQMLHNAKMKLSVFWYNFRWSDWVGYIDGWIPRLSFSVPLVGYLILFNDVVTSALSFVQITSEHANALWLTAGQRLRLVYFGLIALGVSNFLYRIGRPRAFRLGTNSIDYSRACLELFTFRNFLDLHEAIRAKGHLTPEGKYYDSEWDGFRQAATNKNAGTDTPMRSGNWDAARAEFGSLLRSILYESFFRFDREHRGWLAACVILSSLGYVLLAIPSLDLFIKIARSTLTVL